MQVGFSWHSNSYFTVNHTFDFFPESLTRKPHIFKKEFFSEVIQLERSQRNLGFPKSQITVINIGLSRLLNIFVSVTTDWFRSMKVSTKNWTSVEEDMQKNFWFLSMHWILVVQIIQNAIIILIPRFPGSCFSSTRKIVSPMKQSFRKVTFLEQGSERNQSYFPSINFLIIRKTSKCC